MDKLRAERSRSLPTVRFGTKRHPELGQEDLSYRPAAIRLEKGTD